MKIVVTGAEGQLGSDLVLHLESAPHHEVIAADRATCDVADRDAVLGMITTVAPDVVVHCAAFTAVDRCEAEPDAAHKVNALAVRHVAEGCARVRAHLVHLSTDYVFDGTKPAAYHEWDVPNPASEYGRSKLGGEQEACSMLPGATIVRTSWVCGFHGANMVKTILRLAGEHDELRFVDDQRGHPTFTADLAVAVARLAVEHRPGLFHVTNAGAVSWYGFAREVLDAAGLDASRVSPISTADLDPPRAAPRPANSVLDNAAWRFAGLPALRDFREPLCELVNRLSDGA